MPHTTLNTLSSTVKPRLRRHHHRGLDDGRLVRKSGASFWLMTPPITARSGGSLRLEDRTTDLALFAIIA